jgi:hypothetical protein
MGLRVGLVGCEQDDCDLVLGNASDGSDCVEEMGGGMKAMEGVESRVLTVAADGIEWEPREEEGEEEEEEELAATAA